MSMTGKQWIERGHIDQCVAHIAKSMEGELSPKAEANLAKAVEGAVAHYCNGIIGRVLDNELQVAALEKETQDAEKAVEGAIARLEYRIKDGVKNKTRELQVDNDRLTKRNGRLERVADKLHAIEAAFDHFAERAIGMLPVAVEDDDDDDDY